MSKLWDFLKKRDPDFYNVNHPDFKGKIEEAFKAGGTQYYRMREEIDMPYGRYKEISAYLQEVDLRMSLKTLRSFLIELKSYIDGSRGQVNLIMACQTLGKMESRIELQFEPETAKRLATVVYFDDTEDITKFDSDYAKEKMKIWEREESFDFFLTRPMSEWLGLRGISKDSLIAFINQTTDLIRDLTPEMPEASPPTSE